MKTDDYFNAACKSTGSCNICANWDFSSPTTNNSKENVVKQIKMDIQVGWVSQLKCTPCERGIDATSDGYANWKKTVGIVMRVGWWEYRCLPEAWKSEWKRKNSYIWCWKRTEMQIFTTSWCSNMLKASPFLTKRWFDDHILNISESKV